MAKKTYKIGILPGDGIGTEVTAAVKDVFHAADAPVDWEERQAGLAALGQGNEVLPASTLEAIERHKVALKGPCTTPNTTGARTRKPQNRIRDRFISTPPMQTLLKRRILEYVTG